MSTNRKLMLSALFAALAVSFSAGAAEDKPAAPAQTATEKATDKQDKPKKVQRHDHGVENKQGVSAAEPRSGEPKKPLHDHGMMHK